MVKSVYIHIPFCNHICSYCDFTKLLYNSKYINDYLSSLENEIKKIYKGEKVETIYIGGGTPSSLKISELEKMFSIIDLFDKTVLKEFTIECNIEDVSDEKLKLFKDRGINRISIGVQSFNKNLLKIMNRNTEVDIDGNLNLVKKYFDNINIDLIYGFGEETLEILEDDLDKFSKLDIKHISIYSLILESHTAFFNNNYKRVDDDTDYAFYEKIVEKLEKNGFNHYEISNFSKEGFESIHNKCYWNNEEYYGFGLGASGYFDNVRYTNTKNIDKYNRQNYDDYMETLTKKDKMVYEMILGLRQVKGVSKIKFRKKYGCNIDDVFDIIEMKEKKLIIEDNNNIYIPKNKLYVENGILVNFLEVKDEK